MKIDTIIVALALSGVFASASIIPFLSGSPQPTGDAPTINTGFYVDANHFTADTNLVKADISVIPATSDLSIGTVDTTSITSDKT